MSTALALQNHPDTDWESRDIIQTIKDTVCKGATDAQLKMFIEVCKATRLNPWLKEVWFVPGVGIMAGRDGYLRVANEHPMFDGMETVVERDDKGVPIKATCRVWRKDRSHPISCEAYYNEYRKGSQVWTTYKSAMIGKVAEVLALKRSFSINGVVTEEEIGHQEATGSREAQQEVAQRIIAEQAERKALRDRELGVSADDMVPALEASIEDVQQKNEAKRKAGKVDFDVLKRFREIKGKLKKLSGSDERYYAVLSEYGVEHSDSFRDVQHARDTYRGLQAALKDYEAIAALRDSIHQMATGKWSDVFWRVVSGAGYDEDAIRNAKPDDLAKLLRMVEVEVEAEAEALPV